MAKQKISRRELLAGAAATAATMVIPKGVFAHASNEIRIGLIGSGGRGTGAAIDACMAHPEAVIWAIGDLFANRSASSLKHLKEQLKERCKVTDDRVFTGFDNYKHVIDSGVDVVILTAPPGFRPQHLKYAIDEGKHVFMEKPVAVDAPGYRSVIQSSAEAKRKKLTIVAGTQRRHDIAYQQAIEKIHGGDLGDVVAMYAYWNQGGLWAVQKTPEMSDMEWQIRNWLYFTWLSGDMIVEQHVHNIDVCNWVMGKHPVKAISLAGRQVRTGELYGHIYDHFATEFEYENGAKMISMCRQIDGTASRVSEHIVGTKGTSNACTYIRGDNNWRYDGERPNPYVVEHKRLFDSILKNEGFNEGVQVAESTMTAILGRMAGYTGQEITWEQAVNSQENLFPEKLEMTAMEIPPVAMPGKTKLI